MSNSFVFNITSILDDDHEVTKTIPFNPYYNYTTSSEKYQNFVTSSITNSTKYNVVIISAFFTPLCIIYDDIKDSICIIFKNSRIDGNVLYSICQELHELGAVALIVLSTTGNIYTNYQLPVPVFCPNYIPDISYITAKSIQCTITKSNKYLQTNEIPTRDYFVRTFKSSNSMTIQKFLPLYEHYYTSYTHTYTYEEMAELVENFLQGSETMKHKLLVLDYLEKMSWCYRGREKWITFIGSHIGKIISTDNSTLMNLNECLRMISTNEKFFCCSRFCQQWGCDCSADHIDCKIIANHLANACMQIIFDNPKVAQDIPFPTKTSSTPKFFLAFVEALQSGLKRYASSNLLKAAVFYLRVLEQVPSSKELLVHRLSWDLLCPALNTWNPSCITDILDQQLIVILFTPSIADIMDDTGTIMKLRNIVMEVLKVWTNNVKTDSVKLSELVHFKKLVLSNTFEAYVKFVKKPLPSVELIQTKIDSIDCSLLDKRLESIRNNLTIISPVDGQVFALSYILSSCSIIPTENVKLFVTGKITGTTMRETTTISDIHACFVELESLYDAFHLCFYFHRHPSQLFSSILQLTPRKKTAILSLQKNTTLTSDSVKSFIMVIKEAFGSGMHYDGVCSVLRKLYNKVALENELKILVNCKRLQISSTDITHFQIVHLLKNLSIHLPKFIEVCSMCEFKVVDCTKFKFFIKEVGRFFSESFKTFDVCATFLNELYDILCNPIETDASKQLVEEGYFTLLHKKREVTMVLDWIVPFTYISCGFDLWQYILKMEWKGDLGIESFRKKLHRVKNALVLHSATDELHVIESMELVVTLFATIGKYQNCHSMFDFLKVRRDIQNLDAIAKDESIKNIIDELNGRLLSIEDLFNSDLDQFEGVISVQEVETFDQQNSNLLVPVLDVNYETTKQQINLRRWLDYHCLPQTVADLFVVWGIRSVDDVFLFLSKQNQNRALIDELLSQLPILDRMKLCDAASAGSSVASSCDCNDELTVNEIESKISEIFISDGNSTASGDTYEKL